MHKFRAPKDLWAAFGEEVKADGSTMSKELRKFMARYVARRRRARAVSSPPSP
jgi:hypothetical protein